MSHSKIDIGLKNEKGGLYNVTEMQNASDTTSADDDYDHEGAMKYIVCVIIVYAFFGVFCLILVRLRFRRAKIIGNEAKLQADAIQKYLKAERALKFEGHKMKMMTEIEKHAENIRTFEEKIRLLEIENEVKAKDFSFNLKARKKLERKKRKEQRKLDSDKHKANHLRHQSKSYQADNIKPSGDRRSNSATAFKASRGNVVGRRASASDAFGRMGFSFLFLDATRPLQEESNEETDTSSTSSDETEPDKVTAAQTMIGECDSTDSDDTDEPIVKTHWKSDSGPTVFIPLNKLTVAGDIDGRANTVKDIFSLNSEMTTCGVFRQGTESEKHSVNPGVESNVHVNGLTHASKTIDRNEFTSDMLETQSKDTAHAVTIDTIPYIDQ